MNLITSGYDAIDILVSAMEDTLFELKQLPPNPGNLTAFAGTYLANALFGYSGLVLQHAGNPSLNHALLDRQVPHGECDNGC